MKSKTRDLLQCVQTYGEIKSLFIKAYTELTEYRDKVKTLKYDERDLVNFVYVLRETSRYLDELRKEMNAVGDLCEKVCCAIFTKDALNSTETSIRASLATGTPKLRMQAKIPKRSDEPKKFYALMKHFGIDPKTADLDVMRIHWPSMRDSLSTTLAEGKPLPPGIDPEDTYPIYSVTVLQIQDLDELLVAMKQWDDKCITAAITRKEIAIAKMLTERPNKNKQSTTEE